MKHAVAAIVGPTASGKTDISLRVAVELDAEIVSADSMQLYRGMDVGTDKATPEMRERVPHHCLDLFHPAHEVTVAEYQQHARAAIADITDRGKLPLVVGGSGLYVRAVLDDMTFPARDPALRTRLEAEAADLGPHVLHERLERLDPKAASRIEPGNLRRTIRALEVIGATGRPFSDNDSWESYESIYELALAGIARERSDLDARIERRVVAMLARGLRAEVEALAGDLGRTAAQALGYRQVLERPEASDEELVPAIVTGTKRLVRRQTSWFASDPRIRWFDASANDPSAEIVSFFVSTLRLGSNA